MNIPGLDETTFCETETRPRPGFIEISRPRQDRDFYKMIFRDQDETETRPRREIWTEKYEKSRSSNSDCNSRKAVACTLINDYYSRLRYISKKCSSNQNVSWRQSYNTAKRVLDLSVEPRDWDPRCRTRRIKGVFPSGPYQFPFFLLFVLCFDRLPLISEF